MKEQIIEALKQSKFNERYVNICNAYKNVEGGVSFQKEDVLNILKELSCDLKYSSRERVFFQDYMFKENKLRFVISYKYGFIDCSYTMWNEAKTFNLGGTFAEFCTVIDSNFPKEVQFNFPIATSTVDLRSILSQIILLHMNFIEVLFN